MSLMTAQPPLSLIPGEARPIGAAAGIVEDADGGRVFVHGNLTFAWDAGDVAGRRLAAVQLVRIGAAGQKQVAAAFGTAPLTVWRWTRALAEAGVVGLVGERMGPKRKSKLTTDIVAEIVTLRGQGLTLRTIADRVGVSEGSVRNALEAGSETVEDCATTGSDAPVESPPGSESGTSPEPESGFESDDVESGSSSGAGLPVLPGPVDRRGQRGAARWGLLEYAPPVFAPAARVRLAGLFLAVPALAATGLLEGAHATYGQLPRGFYGLDTVVCEAVFRALLGESRAEGATRIDPIELGRVLGLDRAPEVKTIRRRIALLAAQAKADKWIAAMAHTYAAAHPEQMGVLYVDGHVRAYQGTRKVAKTHVARLKFPAPATVETWISDAAGDPVLVVMAEPAASLASELRRLIPDLRAIVGDGRRVLVGFDRGGWSPELFAALDKAGFDTLTWRKGPATDVDETLFTEHTHTDETGRTHRFELADTEIELEVTDTTGPDAARFAMRQITLHDPDRGRQMHILTTRRDLSAGEVRWRMGARWRQENYFRYARMHFDLDSHDSYTATDDDPERLVPNPAKKPAHRQVEKARRELKRAEIDRDTALLAASTPTPGSSTIITNEMLAQIDADLDAAAAALTEAQQRHKQIPARLPLGQVRPGQQVLDIETKLIHHAIRIAAFNTAQTLARTVRLHTGYRRDDQVHALIRTALRISGDIDPDPATGTLHIRLDPLPTPRDTAAIGQLCQILNETNSVYPGTDRRLHYSIKPHR